MTRNFQLIVPAKCTKCGHKSDFVTVVVSGPHLRANCQKCGAYLRFLKTSEAEGVRLPGEDRQYAKTKFYIVTASKREGMGIITKPCLATEKYPHALREQGRLRRLGYISTVDLCLPPSMDLRKSPPMSEGQAR